MMKEYENRIEYLDYLRVLATFAVIVIHIVAYNWYDIFLDDSNWTSALSSDWGILTCYDSLMRWAVPVFVMVSGTLFLSGSEKSIEKIYKKNILRIVTAFVFWSAIYTFLYVGIFECGVNGIIGQFMQGHYHMWFLFMIVGLYMITPFLRKIVESERLTKYYLTLSLIFTFLIPQMIYFVSIKYVGLGETLNTIWDKMEFHFVFGYVSYYICGFWLNKIEIKGLKEKIIYVLGIIGFLLTIYLTNWISIINGQPDETFFHCFTINVLLESIAVFVWVKNHAGRWDSNKYVRGLIRKLSQYSFGAYLVHVIVIKQLTVILDSNILSSSPIIWVPTVSIVVFVISYGISAILNKIPGLNRYIV